MNILFLISKRFYIFGFVMIKKSNKYIEGKDLGAILGLNNFRKELDVYIEKTAEDVLEETGNEFSYWENIFRDKNILSEEYVKRTGFKLIKSGKLIRYSQYPYMACKVDHIAFDNEGNSHIVQFKTSHQQNIYTWGEEWTDQIPEIYLYEVAYNAAIVGASRVDIAVLIGGQDFRIYSYISDLVMEDKLIRVAKKFWNNHVLARVPPKSKVDDRVHTYPKVSGLEVNVYILQDLKISEKKHNVYYIHY